MLYSPTPMHIPDGFLSVVVSIGLWIISAIVVGFALKRVGKDLGERQVPVMGVLAAAIFAGQMLNFTVAGGTSGHLMGAALATILLGPWGAVLVLTCVVSIQAVIFQDGGLLALGANIFNMAVIGVAVSYMVHTTLRKLIGGRSWGALVGAFITGWLSIEVAALAAGLQLALSGTSPANIAIPAMAGIHALIGVGEGLITASAVAFLLATRKDLVGQPEGPTASGGLVWLGGLVFALGLAIVSPLASANPDGLEWVAEQKGFLGLAQAPRFNLIPDYQAPGITNEALATIAAGVLGTLIVFGVALGVAYARRSRPQADR